MPKACRPYRAKTKGKVERMVREVKESFLVWLAGQALPPVVSIADYDALASTVDPRTCPPATAPHHGLGGGGGVGG